MNDILKQLKTINLNIFDKLFLGFFTTLVIYMIITGMSVLTIGGIVLIYGAFLTYKGQIFIATGSYLAADFCWILNAWASADIQGVAFIGTGIFFGIIATYKMKSGHMNKDLLKNNI